MIRVASLQQTTKIETDQSSRVNRVSTCIDQITRISLHVNFACELIQHIIDLFA